MSNSAENPHKIDVARVAFGTFYTPQGDIGLLRLPDDHKWAPNKLDGFTSEQIDGEKAQSALKREFEKNGADIDFSDMEIAAWPWLGWRQDVVESTNSCGQTRIRDTRRTFLGISVSQEKLFNISQKYSPAKVEIFSSQDYLELLTSTDALAQMRRPWIPKIVQLHKTVAELTEVVNAHHLHLANRFIESKNLTPAVAELMREMFADDEEIDVLNRLISVSFLSHLRDDCKMETKLVKPPTEDVLDHLESDNWDPYLELWRSYDANNWVEEHDPKIGQKVWTYVDKVRA